MTKSKNLIGQKIGKLTVLKRKKENKRIYYYCKCDCGNEKWIRSDSLTKKNQTQSCGCLSKETQFKRIDITGKRYDRLNVIRFIGKDERKEEKWLCKCDCGNYIILTKKQLYSSHVKSCGCQKIKKVIENSKKGREKLQKIDFINGTKISNITRKTPIKSNTSGTCGVCWDKSKKKWVAQIEFKSKRYFLGRYENKEDAIKIRKKAEEKLFGEFLNWYKNERGRKNEV